MNRYLLFRLYAPLCSWGDIAVGEVRPTYTHPSKSAIVGLLAAALGIRRDEEDKINNLTWNYGAAILVESFGKPLSDYHTAQVPPGKDRYATRKDELNGIPQDDSGKAIQSWRDYKMDAFYTVALNENGHGLWSLEDIVEKLKQPVFTLYLGRKSCPPAIPFEPQIIEANTLLNAVKKAVFKIDIDGLRGKIVSGNNEKKDLYFEECFRSEVSGDAHIYVRRDMPLSRKRWQFDTRKEYHVAIGG